jgi:hypothetical protein
MLDWTPPLNEDLLTLNGLWTYTRLCHTNAPPLNRQPQPWTLNAFFLTLFSKFLCVLCPKIEWHLDPKIVHLPHSATACDEMGQSKLQTLQIRPTCVCVCMCLCVFRVCVCARVLWLNNDWKKELRCEDLGTKVDPLQGVSNDMAMRALEKSKTDISWVLAKEAIKDDFLCVPLRLNACLHWTIWLIPKGV